MSSHSSDSSRDLRKMPFPRCAPLGLLSNKFNILSPISDKSQQEPGSETSENKKYVFFSSLIRRLFNHPSLNVFRNNNSQKTSPEEVAKESTPSMQTDELPWDSVKPRRRLQTKNVINQQTNSETLQASDSGISIASRHLENLPFDMPKLRRRLAGAATTSSATSSSANSVASTSKVENLPFDMPKLRRRNLRSNLDSKF
jgi:SH2 domain-containing adapter protein B/D/E/F